MGFITNRNFCLSTQSSDIQNTLEQTLTHLPFHSNRGVSSDEKNVVDYYEYTSGGLISELSKSFILSSPIFIPPVFQTQQLN